MTTDNDAATRAVAERWCQSKGPGWSILSEAGRGGTAPVYTLGTPDGPMALKVYDEVFSTGPKATIEQLRIDQQVALGIHDCPYLIKIHGGGRFEGRFFLLMNLASGKELEKRLTNIPRDKIRSIVNQVTQAVIFLQQRGLCHRDIKSANIFISDDFEIATLLDLSVMRNFDDPVGVGTDQKGQLPVVATARYSPPEYLFRLIDPDQSLWYALNIYQLGGLLHDLIMREPLFEQEYSQSKENRYRFAWVIATVDPFIACQNVDQDLVFIAKRALDKNWRRRSELTLDDFLDSSVARRQRALEAIGLQKRAAQFSAPSAIGGKLRRVAEIASELEGHLLSLLKVRGVTAHHYVGPGDNDFSKVLRLTWNADRAPSEGVPGVIEFNLLLTLVQGRDRPMLASTTSLEADVGGTRRRVAIALPEIEDTPAATTILGQQAEEAIGTLAAQLMLSPS